MKIVEKKLNKFSMEMELAEKASEILTYEDSLKCGNKCCHTLFFETGPSLHPMEIMGIAFATYEVRNELFSEGKNPQKIIEYILKEHIIMPSFVKKEVLYGGMIKLWDEPICSLYSVERKKCLIYNDRPLVCRLHPLIVDNGKIWIDSGCPYHVKVLDHLKQYGIVATPMNLLEANRKIALKY